jgi:hypothetical protein
MVKVRSEMSNEQEPEYTGKPESFRNLELMARTLFAVPKAEVDALEKQEKKQATNKPSK